MEKRSELILESLDSVWFFSNIFSPPSTTQLVHYHDYPNKAQEEDEDEGEEAPKPITPLPTQNQQVESSPPPSDHAVLPIKKKTKSRRRKRRKRCNRKILGELELEFNGCDLWEFGGGDDDDDDDDQVMKNSKEEECGCGLMFGRSQLGQENYQMKDQKMPPLHDGLAMKEHLKSWAYAVACTVR